MSEETIIIESGFSTKLNKDDKERTEVVFSLDFSGLDRQQIADWASREYSRVLSNKLRDGDMKLEELQGKTLSVPKFEKGERGKAKVTEEVALAKLAETYGISVDAMKAMLAKVKGAVK